MTSLLNADLPSEDEEDEDFEAPEEGGRSKAAAKKRRRGQAPAEGEAAAAEQAADAVDELQDMPVSRAKKGKVDALWQQLRQGTAVSKPKPIGSLMSLERKSAISRSSKGKGSDVLWMRSLGLAPKSTGKAAGAASQAPTHSKPAAEAPSSDHSEQVAAQQHTAAKVPAGTASGAAAAAGDVPGPAEPNPTTGASSSGSKASLAAAALAAAKELSVKGVASSYNKVTITETRKFAGKDIQVQLQVDKESKAAKAAAERQKQAASGMDAFLLDIEKKKKVTVLDKTKMDWNEAKAADTNMEEELETHKRSGAQYLDKQDFLKRAELREYEQERDKRLAADVRLRGRL